MGIRHRVRALLALAALIASIVAVPALAEDAKPAKQKVELAGQLVCVGCHLEKQFGAEAQCALHARHAQGFLAEDGTLYALLDNGRGHALITDRKLAGVSLKLEAYAFPKAQVLEVIRFRKKEGDAFTQYDFCRNCGFEKGDHAGKDLCPDCER